MGEMTLKKPRYLDDPPQQEPQPGQAGSVGTCVAEPHLKTNAETDQRTERDSNRDLDREYIIRALSHDVGAHLMLLEFSFRHYDELAKRLLAEADTIQTAETRIRPSHENAPGVPPGEYQASGGRIFFRRDDAGNDPPTPHRERVSQNPNSSKTGPAPPSPQPGPVVMNEAASHVTACLDEMKRFVDELISFAKTGNIDMEPSTVDIAELVGEVLFEQRRLIEKRKVDITISSPLPKVYANPLRIKQVLTNLVRNAAIHGCDADTPMIVIASEPITHNATNTASESDAMTCFFVRDNGRGIPQAECERIFEPGYRVPGNQNEGSGVGLAIVRKIASYYGGNVMCESNADGTTFAVTLPKG